MVLYIKNLVRYLALIFIFIVCACASDDEIKPKIASNLLKDRGSQSENKTDLSVSVQDTGAISDYKARLANNPVKIAILLPLSGTNSKLGKQLLDAAQLALFDFNNSNIVLVPIDTGENNVSIANAADRAVSIDAKLIIGPLFSDATKIVNKIAKEHDISVISFSNDKSLASSGVFVLGITPQPQIDRILKYVHDKFGIINFASLVPNNSYGSALDEQVRNTISKFNDDSHVLANEAYNIDSSGNAINIESRVNIALNSVLNGAALTKKSSSSYLGAIIIPEGSRRITNIADILAAKNFDNNKILLLGSSQWYDDSLLSTKQLEGALFATPIKERQMAFENKFENTYGYKPKTISSLAYDAIALAVTLPKLFPQNPYSANNIANERGYSGIDGIFRFNKDGLAERAFAIMQIKQGKFVVVDPAPTSFISN